MKNMAAPYAAATPIAATAIIAVVPFVVDELFCESILKTPVPPPPAVSDVVAPVPVAVRVPSAIEPPGMRDIDGFI